MDSSNFKIGDLVLIDEGEGSYWRNIAGKVDSIIEDDYVWVLITKSPQKIKNTVKRLPFYIRHLTKIPTNIHEVYSNAF